MLLVITSDPDTMQALRDAEVAFVAAPTAHDATTALTVDPMLAGALVAYGPDYVTSPDPQPLDSELIIDGIVILPTEAPPAMMAAAFEMNAPHVITLPEATPWLRRRLRLLAAAHRAVRADLAGAQA